MRKMLGGGMRQAGIIAAAGLFVLENHRERMADDHEHARLLATALNSTSWAKVVVLPETNIVFADTTLPAQVIVTKLQTKGVLCGAMGENKVRFVTHLDVGRTAIDRACAILGKVS